MPDPKKQDQYDRGPGKAGGGRRLTDQLLVAQLVFSAVTCVAAIVLVALSVPIISRAGRVVQEYTLVLADPVVNPDAAMTPERLNAAVADAMKLIDNAGQAAEQAPALLRNFRNISDAIAAKDVSSMTASSARIMAEVPSDEIARIIVGVDELLRLTAEALDADAIRQLTQTLAQTPADLTANIDKLLVRTEELFAASKPYIEAMQTVRAMQPLQGP